jgi:hypothetical protein
MASAVPTDVYSSIAHANAHIAALDDTRPYSATATVVLPPVKGSTPRPGTHSMGMRDHLITPSWASGMSTASSRIIALAEPRPYISSRTTPVPPTVSWGREHRRVCTTPERFGDALNTARSVASASWEAPVALTSPRLSPHFRVPMYVPPSSRKGASPPKSCPLSPRSPRALHHTVTRAVVEEQGKGRHLYEAVRRGDVAALRALIQQGADVDHRGPSFRNTGDETTDLT